MNIHSTVKSFVELARFLLSKDEIKFILSCKLNQDPLEEYFGKQRAIGRRADNPTVKQYLDNTSTLHMVSTAGVHVRGGNVKRQLAFRHDIDAPLRKRRRPKTSDDLCVYTTYILHSYK